MLQSLKYRDIRKNTYFEYIVECIQTKPMFYLCRYISLDTLDLVKNKVHSTNTPIDMDSRIRPQIRIVRQCERSRHLDSNSFEQMCLSQR